MQPSAGLLLTLGLSVCLAVNAEPYVRDEVPLQNGEDAISLNAKFKTLSPLSPCRTDEVACVSGFYAQCLEGHFVLTPCPTDLVCQATSNVDSSKTIIGCTIERENTIGKIARGLNRRAVAPDDPSQSSLTLDSSVIASGLSKDGQDNITSPGQSGSATTTNNWINFCMTVDKPLTNGTQIPGGSCNPVPQGVIPSQDNMPSAKFIFPPNFAAVTKNQTFTIQIAINHLETGWFTNSFESYFAAPVQVNADGDVIGHSHVVIQKLTGFGQTTPLDPKTFVFATVITTAAVNGVLSVNAPALDVGFYRIATFHSAANHQPIAVPIPRHGAMGDMVYFSVL